MVRAGCSRESDGAGHGAQSAFQRGPHAAQFRSARFAARRPAQLFSPWVVRGRDMLGPRHLVPPSLPRSRARSGDDDMLLGLDYGWMELYRRDGGKDGAPVKFTLVKSPTKYVGCAKEASLCTDRGSKRRRFGPCLQCMWRRLGRYWQDYSVCYKNQVDRTGGLHGYCRAYPTFGPCLNPCAPPASIHESRLPCPHRRTMLPATTLPAALATTTANPTGGPQAESRD